MFLTDLVERLSAQGVNPKDMIDFPLTREDVADAIGITPVHLSRISSELRKEKVLDCRYGKLKIRNLDLLRSIAGENTA